MRVYLSRGCVAAFWAMPSWLTRSFCSKAYRSAACFDLVFSFGHLTDSVFGNDLASIVYICGKCTRCLGYHNFSRIDVVLEYKPCIVITGFVSTVLAIKFACSFILNFVKYLTTSYNRRKPTYYSWTLVNKGHGNISWVWRENYVQKKNSDDVEDSADKGVNISSRWVSNFMIILYHFTHQKMTSGRNRGFYEDLFLSLEFRRMER